MKSAAVFFGLILIATPPCGHAQEGAPSPPPPSDRPDKPNRDHSRGPHQGFGSSGGYGMMSREDREHFDIFKDMPEDQKQRVRAAFEKAWKKSEVTEARERLMKANEEYRKILHEALAEVDPEVVKILEKRKPSTGPGFSGKMPDANDPEFVGKALQRLRIDGQPGGPGERRESPMSRMHERLMQTPAVAEAVKQLQQAEPAKRLEAWEKLREVYQVAIKGEFAKMRENFKKDGSVPGLREPKNGPEPAGEPQKP